GRGARSGGHLCHHDLAGECRSSVVRRRPGTGYRRAFPSDSPGRPARRAGGVEHVDGARSAMKSRVRHATPDGDAELDMHRTRRSILRRVAEVAFISLFFAVVLFAAVPMGANRDWAWGPIVVLLGALAVWHALGLGINPVPTRTSPVSLSLRRQR